MLSNKEKYLKKLETLKRRKESFVPKTIELKIDLRSLSKEKLNYLNRLFLEAKWFYNFCINNLEQKDLIKLKEVQVKLKDGSFETRELKYLSSQMRQSIVDRIFGSIKSLSILKKNKSQKIGHLKFKKEINSIPLRTFNQTYTLESNKIRFQGFKKKFKIFGTHQFEEAIEIGCANLIRKSSGFYIKVLGYFEPKALENQVQDVLGIDFGIKDSLVLSTGQVISKINFDEPKRLKKLQRKFSKATKGSKNKFKLQKKVNRYYEKMDNQKKDLTNKIIHDLKQYKYIAVQDEAIKAWHSGLFGKQVQHSILGRIKSKLNDLETTYVVDRWTLTTRVCSYCGTKHPELTLEDREFKCCQDFLINRDLNAALNIRNLIIKEHQNIQIPRGTGDFKLVEFMSDLKNYISIVPQAMNNEPRI